MSIQFNDGNSYSSWVDYYGGNPDQQAEKNSYHEENNEGDQMKYRSDLHKAYDKKEDVKFGDPDYREPRNYLHPMVDREHHVPLLASAIMGEDGNMNGLAISHQVKLSPQDEELVGLHEATELPIMNDYIRAGMKPSDAYAKAHAHAIERETAASIARWGEDGHEAYKQRMRDAVAIASQPSDRPRHPDAHTTRYGLDESELGQKFAENITPHDPGHPLLEMDVLGAQMSAGHGIHSGPGVGRFSRPANMNKKSEQLETPEPDIAKGPFENAGEFARDPEGNIEMTPDQFKYYEALFKQQDARVREQKEDDPWVITREAAPDLNKGVAGIIFPKTPEREAQATKKYGEDQRRQQLRDYAKERAENMTVGEAAELMKKHPGKSFEEVTGEDNEP